MTDLVVVSLERWDDVWRRNQHLVDGLLRADPELRVLFVEPAADPLHDLVSGRLPSFGRGAAPLGDTGRLWRARPVKLLPRRLDRRADHRLRDSIIRSVRRLGFDRPVLWLNDPGFAPLSESTRWPTLYDITDDWLTAVRPPHELVRLAAAEGWLLSHARAVVVCSPELVRRKAPLRSGSIELIPNAVDVAAYRRRRVRPRDLPASTAVYAGTLHADRLDVELCARTAAALPPNGRLAMVGPDALTTTERSALRDAGILILGPRSRDDLIAYLQHAEVLVVPHAVTSFTDSLDPIKLYEYSAADRPVVSTPVAGFRDSRDPRVRVVEPAEFPAAVRAALDSAASEVHGSNADGVLTADWSDRVVAMRAVLARLAE